MCSKIPDIFDGKHSKYHKEGQQFCKFPHSFPASGYQSNPAYGNRVIIAKFSNNYVQFKLIICQGITNNWRLFLNTKYSYIPVLDQCKSCLVRNELHARADATSVFYN